MSIEKGSWQQNVGANAINNTEKELASWTGENPSNFAAKSLRRSGTTQLAEAGMDGAIIGKAIYEGKINLSDLEKLC